MVHQAPTVADVAWSFYRAMESAGAPPNSLIRYKSNMLALLDQLGGKPVRAITPAELGLFLDTAPSQNVRTSRRTIANHVMRHAYRGGHLRTPIEVPRDSYRPRATKSREWTRYSADQLRALLQAAPCERSRIALSIAIYTAMRVEDIRMLRAPAPDLSEGWLAAWINKSGIFDFKVIAHSFEDDMRRYLRWLYERADGAITAEDYLLPGYPAGFRGGGNYNPDLCDFSKPISKGTLDERYVEARDRAGLPHLSRERWHTLRRSSGRLFFEAASGNGYDMALRMTQAFLNHQSVTTTERYIGLDIAYAMRDEFLREYDLLAAPAENVLPLRRRAR